MIFFIHGNCSFFSRQCCSGFTIPAPTDRPSAGYAATRSRAQRSCSFNIFIAPWGGWVSLWVGNKGYRRYLKTAPKEHFEVDEQKIEDEQIFDGKYVLLTNTDLHPMEAALQYKQLWMVEDIFRTMKSLLQTRPIFHKCDDTIRGHVFCSFLALVIRKRLYDKLEKRGWKLEWNSIIEDANSIVDVTMTHGSKSFAIRTEATGVAGKVFQAAGVALPPVLRDLEFMSTTPGLRP